MAIELMAEGKLNLSPLITHRFRENTNENDISLVLNFIHAETPRPFRRKAQATFVVSILEADETPEDILKAAYPFLIRSLANHLVYICHEKACTNFYFITPEQGWYKIAYSLGDQEDLFSRIYQRLEPVASARLVIDNEFQTDLPQEFWNGDEITKKLSWAGKRLDRLNLLPAPFPIHEYLTSRDWKHLKKLFGVGGLSYGNLSNRRDRQSFWMSASGVDKSNFMTVGEDMLLIKDYDEERNRMLLSVPSDVNPKRASVDAIEHWMIYKEHPKVGAIVHIHAWMDGVKATEINYPCGTMELAETVAELISQEEDPAKESWSYHHRNGSGRHFWAN